MLNYNVESYITSLMNKCNFEKEKKILIGRKKKKEKEKGKEMEKKEKKGYK